MAFIQRYLFRQLLVPTLATTAALGGVAVLSQSLTLLNLAVSERQQIGTFVQLVLLTVPSLIAFVVPVTCFVATLYAMNKLHTEQEIVVCFAAGLSRWQVTSPALRLAAAGALIVLAINLWAAPACGRVARELIYKARTDLAGSLVQEGEFSQTQKGLTVYAQRIDAQGVLHNLFVYQEKPGGASATYDAKLGVLTHRGAAPVLIMQHGSNEQFSPAGILNFLDFDEYVLDLTPYMSDEPFFYKPSDMYMHELLFPDPHAKDVRWKRSKMLAEANARLASPLYIPTFVLFAILAVIGGPFSRLGYTRQIAVAGAAALMVRLLGVTIQAACENSALLNLLQYLAPVLPGWWAARRLFRGEARAARSRSAAFAGELQPIGA
jgi:lipopolysaccharide export system permease protein